MEEKELSRHIHDLLAGTGKTLATAESCTGGAVAAAIVATSGASEYFKGGIVSYCNEIKERVLGVSRQTLDEQTAVCQDVAVQMAQGARRVLSTDFAVAITGIAGPGGGSAAIPVGTIWLAFAGDNVVLTKKLTADLGREANLQNAVREALLLIDENVHCASTGQ